VIVAVRILLLALAAAALTAAAAIGLRGRGGEGTASAGIRYACPMHPEVRSAASGECPICRMALERVGGVATGGRGHTQEEADLAAVENVKRHNVVDFVRRRSLLVPSRELRGPATVGADGVVTALFYDDEIAALDADERGSFTPTADPARVLTVRRIAGGLPRSWDRSTSQVQFRFEGARKGKAGKLGEIGEVGWVELAPRPRQVLTVPASALVQSPEGPYVLAWTGRGFEFERRPIEIGETYLKQGFAVVLAGLKVNERIVSRATFFLEADRRASHRRDDEISETSRSWGPL
jgi:hypothetical protein